MRLLGRKLRARTAAGVCAAALLVTVSGCATRPGPAQTAPPSAAARYVRGAPLAPVSPPAPPPNASPRATQAQATPVQSQPAAPAGLHEVFPHVRADVANRVVEFDVTVSPMLVKDPCTPLFYLEVVACSPDTREHESLLVSTARPSHVHAAMLLIGLKPGNPGGWKLEGGRLAPIDPSGDRVDLRVVMPDPADPGRTIEADPMDWIISARDGRGIRDSIPPVDGRGTPASAPGWVFAGSRVVSGQRAAMPTGEEPREVYEADGSGTLIGLATFGGETISWSRTFSPDASVDAPEWIAKLDATPPAGAAVVVRVRPVR